MGVVERGWGSIKRGAGLHSRRREQGMKAAISIANDKKTEWNAIFEMETI